jgi:hypothetical protein
MIKEYAFLTLAWFCIGFAATVIVLACIAMLPLRWLIEWDTKKK